MLNNYKSTNLFKVMNNDIESATINHAYMIYGQDKDVLKELSKQMAKHLQCLNHNPPCNNCAICNNIQNEIYSDVIIYPKKSDSIKVEDANNIVNESIIVSFESEKKVIIINNFDKANQSAQNKLLKTLEEPVKNIVFILNAENEYAVLNTIKSRTKKVFISDVSEKEASRQEMLKQDKMSELALLVLKDIQKSSEIISVSNEILNYESEFNSFIITLQEFLADIIKVKSGVEKTFVNNQKYLNEIANISHTMSIEGFSEVFKNTDTMAKMIASHCNINLVLEDFLIKFLEVRYKCQKNA